jgi:hypothetical protein
VAPADGDFAVVAESGHWRKWLHRTQAPYDLLCPILNGSHEQVSAAMDECPVFDLAHANAFLKQLGGKRLAKAEAVMTIVRAPKLRRSLMRPLAPEGDARFANKLDHANAATYSDEAGWKSSVVPKRAGRILDRFVLAQGVIYITAPSGETRRSHFWMDRLELRGDRRRRGYRDGTTRYYDMSVKERAAIEAKLQATAYAPLREQFELCDQF